MLARPDLLSPRSPTGLEVFQLTTEQLPSSHIYMEAQIFAPDSKRLVLHRSAHPHGSDRHDPEHRYLLVDLDAPANDNLRPLTDELGPTGPSIAPDGKHFYYFVDHTELNAGSLTLKRCRLDGTQRETVCVVDAPLPGAKARISQVYPLSTISSDGKRIAICGYLGDGRTNFGPWGLVVFDIGGGRAELILAGPSWCNIHPQYCRSTDAGAIHDILVQENHDNVCNLEGQYTKLCGGPGDGGHGADIHVIRDDGSDFRNLPWGRTGKEFCQGHQCWLGRSTSAITAATLWEEDYALAAVPGMEAFPGSDKARTRVDHLVEGVTRPFDGHTGARPADGKRNVLSRGFTHPGFSHFATDIAGRRFVTDAHSRPARGWDLYTATFGRPMADALSNWTYLLDTRTSTRKAMHPHPFLSPDGKLAFFNSDETGVLQAYMVRGLPA